MANKHLQKSLQGCRILVTRPVAQADHWQKLLSDSGAESVLAPLLAIRPFEESSDADAVRLIKNGILDFDRFTHIVFVSQNAVRIGLDWLDEYWPQLPQRQTFFAVGKATAEAIKARHADVVAAEKTMNSEALLALPELQPKTIAGAKVLIFRGHGGRPILGDVLQERGATVSYCELYQREFPGGPDLIKSILAKHQWGKTGDVVAVHSGESLHNWHSVVVSCEQQQKQMLLAQPLLVPSERVAKAAQEFGFSHVVTSENASDDTMLETLQRWSTSTDNSGDYEPHNPVIETPATDTRVYSNNDKAPKMTSPETSEESKVDVPLESKRGEKPVDNKKNTPHKKSPTAKTGTKSLWVINILLLLVVSGLIAAGYLGWQKLQSTDQVIRQSVQQRLQGNKAIELRVQQQDQLLNNHTKSLITMRTLQKSGEEKWQLQLTSHDRQLRQQQQQLNSLTSTSRSDWQLAEAEYLLRLASQNLLMNQGSSGALELLQRADQILSDIGDMDLFAVRQELAKDIAQLKLLPRVDRAGIYLQLAALNDQLQYLPDNIEVILAQPKITEEIAETNVSESLTWLERLMTYFKIAMKKLDKYVQVRPHDRPIKPLLSRENSEVVRQNVSLLLEQAQLALLKDEAEIFQQSLARANRQIENYFSQQQASVIIVEQLREISKRPIVVKTPSINGSLKALQHHIALLHRLEDVADIPAAELSPTNVNEE